MLLGIFDFWLKNGILEALFLALSRSRSLSYICFGLWLRVATHGARTQARTGTWERKKTFAEKCAFLGV